MIFSDSNKCNHTAIIPMAELILTHKVLITTAADDILNFYAFSEKIRLEISCESSEQTIHMKCQVLFSLKKKKKKIECRLLQICIALLGLRFNLCPSLQLLYFQHDADFFFFFFFSVTPHRCFRCFACAQMNHVLVKSKGWGCVGG